MNYKTPALDDEIPDPPPLETAAHAFMDKGWLAFALAAIDTFHEVADDFGRAFKVPAPEEIKRLERLLIMARQQVSQKRNATARANRGGAVS
jgi:hypothetical protein